MCNGTGVMVCFRTLGRARQLILLNYTKVRKFTELRPEKGKNDGNFRMQNRDGRPGKKRAMAYREPQGCTQRCSASIGGVLMGTLQSLGGDASRS